MSWTIRLALFLEAVAEMHLTTYRFIHDWLKIDLCFGYFQETTSVANEEKSLWSI